jgi:hypothetical protein
VDRVVQVQVVDHCRQAVGVVVHPGTGIHLTGRG